jgi:ADP-ribose pyrophosphatase YjhB (NUDIX family)
LNRNTIGKNITPAGLQRNHKETVHLFIKKILLAIWRLFPHWLQQIASRMIRPLFQVYSAAVIFNEQKEILLVKLTYQRIHPWGIPGGGLNHGEQPAEAVVREMFEETGITLEIEKLLFIKTWKPDRVGMYYLCRIKEGVFQPSEEVSDFGYFSKDNLPDVRPFDIRLIQQIYEMVNEHELA